MTKKHFEYAAQWIADKRNRRVANTDETALLVWLAVDLFNAFGPNFDGPRFRERVRALTAENETDVQE